MFRSKLFGPTFAFSKMYNQEMNFKWCFCISNMKKVCLLGENDITKGHNKGAEGPKIVLIFFFEMLLPLI